MSELTRVKQQHDVDSAEAMFRLRAGTYAVIVGAIGVGLGAGLAGWAGVLGGALAGCATYFGTLYLAERTGSAAASIYHGSGSSTPALRQYSLADSYVARGHIQEALDEYARNADAFPADPEPLLRRARVLRDHRADFEAAAADLKRVIAIPALPPQTELAALREIIELYVHRSNSPGRALPFLARTAEKFQGTPTADWARGEIARIKDETR